LVKNKFKNRTSVLFFCFKTLLCIYYCDNDCLKDSPKESLGPSEEWHSRLFFGQAFLPSPICR
jgi:hypothetical protein